MAKINISGGNFQDAEGNALAGGLLVLTLDSAAVVIGTGQVVNNLPLFITLDGTGNAPSTPIWFNDQLSPTGTAYSVTLFSASGKPAWTAAQLWQFLGGAAINLDTMVPTSIGVSYPSALIINSPTLQTVTGPVTFTDIITADIATADIATANITNMNGILNALDFPGSDIGTQVNAAIATLPASGGEVYIPAGTYTQTTTILLPRTVKLHGASGFSTQLNYTPTTGWAVIMADAVAAAAFCPQGALEDLSLVSSSMSNANGAIYIGGTDGATPVGKTASPSSAVNPSTNFGDNTNIHRVRIMETGASGAFGVGIQWGNNAWSTNIFECTVSFCAIGLYFPATISLANSGENISIIGGIVGNNTLGLSIGGYALSGVDFHLTNVSFDYNTSWAIQNGTSADTSLQVTLDGCHIEQVNFWIQNFGIMSLTNCILVNGSSATVFLIDNEYPAFSMVGCEILTSCPALFKSAGYPATLVGNFSNTSLNNSAQLIDVVGNILTKGYVIASSFIGTTVQGGSSLYLSTSGTFLGWNYTGGSGESDFFNNYLTGGTQPTFQFYGNYSGTPALLFSIDGSGNTNPAGYLTINAATPTGSITGIAFGDTTGFGNGASGNVTVLAKGSGSGPTTPGTVIGFMEINVNGTVAWVPYCH